MMLSALLCYGATSAESETDKILVQLSNVRLDKNQIYRVRDMTIRRDTLAVSFNRGVIAFTEPIAGRVTGAIFLGDGQVLAIPTDPLEKQQLHRFTGSPLLNEKFSAAVMRFSDGTYDEILREYADRAQEEVTAEDRGRFEGWDSNLTDRSGVLNQRLLGDLVGSGRRPLFLAGLRSERLGWFDVIYDEALREEVLIVQTHQGKDDSVRDVWASFNKRSEARDPEAVVHEDKSLLDVLEYDIDTTVLPDSSLTAVTTVRLQGRGSGERALNFGLSRSLRMSEAVLVTDSGSEPLPFYQHQGMAEDEISRYGMDAFVVVLPRPITGDAEVSLRFSYSGDVIEEKGGGIFHVRDHGLWYPNVGPQDLARYRMAFRVPLPYTLVATGRKVREWEENGLRHSEWTGNRELPIAGFNYGDFAIFSDLEAVIPVQVVVNNDVEDTFKEIENMRRFYSDVDIRELSRWGRRRYIPFSGGWQMGAVSVLDRDFRKFSTKALATNVLEEVRSILDFYTDKFGPYPYEGLIVSQFPEEYSQGWPSLLYVSTPSLFTPEQRKELGLESDGDFKYAELVWAHEIAHQWFGNKAGWRSYHDTWIHEGLAHYAGGMYIEHKYQDDEPLRELLNRARKDLLEQTPSGETWESTGPIWLGYRLSSSITPDGYLKTVYNKALWVTHMLRMMMRENGSDERFLRMVRNLLEEFDGKFVSTWDFKRLAEKHMIGAMDLADDGTLDWFFDSWVFGAGVPIYSLDYAVQSSDSGFTVTGRIIQEGVSSPFAMLVPLYVDDGEDLRELGRVVVGDGRGGFRFTVRTRPKNLVIDPHGSVLAQTKERKRRGS